MIIKKCPAYYNNLGCMGNKVFYTSCEKENNCIMKKVIKEYPQLKELLGVEEEEEKQL
jgi:hypothetical protein